MEQVSKFANLEVWVNDDYKFTLYDNVGLVKKTIIENQLLKKVLKYILNKHSFSVIFKVFQEIAEYYDYNTKE